MVSAMVSKRRFNYRMRLFIPMIGIMWLIIGLLVFYQYRREVSYRTEEVKKQLDIVDNRIINAYEKGIDLRPFMNFLNDYFTDTMFDEVSVIVMEKTGKLLYNVGTPVIQDFSQATDRKEISEALATGSGSNIIRRGDSIIFFTALTSEDGEIIVHTTMPYKVSLLDAIGAEPQFWILLVLFVIAATGICYYFTHLITRNVTLLKDFAERAANNEEIIDTENFPHDELGDISRQIVRLYKDKDDAIKREEKEHSVALNAIEEKARIKRHLTNNINHELKTPVGIIKGYLDTIQGNPDMDQKTKERFMSRIHENVDRLCTLLNDVSTMTRLEDGSGNIPVTEIDFHDLVFTLENDLVESGVTEDMKFLFDLPLNCKVKGNATLLNGMISNLVKNSVKYSKGTEMMLNLIVESENYYTFRFTDNGTGVDPEHLPHLFERFYRIDAGRSRKSGGTGLGLPIVKNTVEALGGTIFVHNGSEGGLEFVFTLEKWKSNENNE